jgi:hypothetical protein
MASTRECGNEISIFVKGGFFFFFFFFKYPSEYLVLYKVLVSEF